MKPGCDSNISEPIPQKRCWESVYSFANLCFYDHQTSGTSVTMKLWQRVGLHWILQNLDSTYSSLPEGSIMGTSSGPYICYTVQLFYFLPCSQFGRCLLDCTCSQFFFLWKEFFHQEHSGRTYPELLSSEFMHLTSWHPWTPRCHFLWVGCFCLSPAIAVHRLDCTLI